MKKFPEINMEALTPTHRRIASHLLKNGRISELEVKGCCVATELKNYRLDSNVANVHIMNLKRSLPNGLTITRIRGDAMEPGYWKLQTV